MTYHGTLSILQVKAYIFGLFNQLENDIILRNLWNVALVHEKGCIFESAQHEKGIISSEV